MIDHKAEEDHVRIHLEVRGGGRHARSSLMAEVANCALADHQLELRMYLDRYLPPSHPFHPIDTSGQQVFISEVRDHTSWE